MMVSQSGGGASWSLVVLETMITIYHGLSINMRRSLRVPPPVPNGGPRCQVPSLCEGLPSPSLMFMRKEDPPPFTEKPLPWAPKSPIAPAEKPGVAADSRNLGV